MGINGITSANGMSAMQFTSADLKDQKSKSIQTEITDVQQQMQKISSDEELSVNEKENERKKLQKEKSSLDNELKQHQEELLRSQKREAMLAELRKAQNPTKEEETKDEAQAAETSSDTAVDGKRPVDEPQTAQPGTVITQNSDGTVILKEVMKQADNSDADQETAPTDESGAAAVTAAESEPEDDKTKTDPAEEFRPTEKEMHSMVSADSSMQIANRQGALVTKTNDGIAILKGEIKQDEYRGTDTERKQAELKEMQKQNERAQAYQLSFLHNASSAMQTAAETDASAKDSGNAAERTFYVSGLHVPQDEQAAQQGFQVSIA